MPTEKEIVTTHDWAGNGNFHGDGKWQGGRKLSEYAHDSAATEESLSPVQAIRAYPAAVAWSLVVSTAVIMEGYDTILISNLFAFPQFQISYGEPIGGGRYQLTPAWQAGLSQAAGAGAFFGTLLNGYLVSLFGQKRVLLTSLVCLTGFIFLTFFAPTLPILCAGEVLCGLPWGIIATTAPAYASEVLPSQLRVYLTSYTNMCFIIGQLIAAGVLEGLVGREDEWAYRIPFALQWAWPVFLIPMICYMPESPWHLVRQGQIAKAENSLRRLISSSSSIDVKKTLAVIIYTNNLEEKLSVGTTYWDCFKGFELRRTEIACLTFAGQVLSGAPFAYNSTYFFEQVGIGSDSVYKLNVGGTALALIGTLINWFLLMPHFGRRSIYIGGCIGMLALLVIVGIMNPWNEVEGIPVGQAALTLAWTFVYQFSVGQLGWALPAEVGSTRLRQKTVCIARNSYYLSSVIGGVLEQYYVSPTAWNLKGYTGFIWASSCLFMVVWAYFRLPETKNRPYEELDILFAKKISARKFKKTNVDAFDEHDTSKLAARYSVAGPPSEVRRPSFVPNVSKTFARIGTDKAYSMQRQSSIAAQGGLGSSPASRRPSIAAAVDDYLRKAHDAESRLGKQDV